MARRHHLLGYALLAPVALLALFACSSSAGAGAIDAGGDVDASNSAQADADVGECSLPQDCPGTDTTCAQRTCEDGECRVQFAGAGTECVEDDGSVCDGEGGCVECLETEHCTGDDVCDTAANLCVPPSCQNGELDEGETDVDCGGPDCPPCGEGDACEQPDDCATGACDELICSLPAVRAVSPEEGTVDAPVDTTIAITFNAAMDPQTLSAKTSLDADPCAGAIQVSTDGFDTCLPFASETPAMSEGGTVATLTPAPGLAFGQKFQIRVSTDAASITGAPLADEFQTVDGFDTQTDPTGEVKNETFDELEADFCNVQHPPEITVAADTETELVFGRLFDSVITDGRAGSPDEVRAELGFGPRDKNPQWQDGWEFVPADFNDVTENNHEYMATIPGQDAGVYGYAYRFSLDEGQTWTYCSHEEGSGSNPLLTFDVTRIPVLTVTE